jgi:hypothetical protein
MVKPRPDAVKLRQVACTCREVPGPKTCRIEESYGRTAWHRAACELVKRDWNANAKRADQAGRY